MRRRLIAEARGGQNPVLLLRNRGFKSINRLGEGVYSLSFEKQRSYDDLANLTALLTPDNPPGTSSTRWLSSSLEISSLGVTVRLFRGRKVRPADGLFTIGVEGPVR